MNTGKEILRNFFSGIFLNKNFKNPALNIIIADINFRANLNCITSDLIFKKEPKL